MKKIKIGLLGVLFLVFLISCISSQSRKSDSIQHILTKVVNDGKAPGMIAAIISSEGVRDIP